MDRLETDSVYRDSVRRVIIDSLEKHDPEFRKRMQQRRLEREKQEKQLKAGQAQSGGDQPPLDAIRQPTAMRHEQEEINDLEERSVDE